MAILLQTKDLRVTFQGKEGPALAVRGIDLELHEGESLGIVGESGSGKSVTSLAMMGLLPSPPALIQAENLQFLNMDLLTANRKTMQGLRGKGMAMIFQEPMTSLDPAFTVGNQLAEPIMIHLGLSRKEANELSLDLLSKVEIPNGKSLLNYYPHQLSGGMRQRIMIAMAISCGPQLLIADEPTTALDVTIQAQVLDLIVALQKEKNMALIMITHDMGVIAQTSDKVAVMYGGLIMEYAEVVELFKNPLHPYTEALLASIPRPDLDSDKRLFSIPGGAPNPKDPPTGCPFHPRCPKADAYCHVELPKMKEITVGHGVRCWRAL